MVRSKLKRAAIVTAVGRYIRAKIKRTRCMGKHMRQVCHRCGKYKGGGCTVYKEYFDAWVSLQNNYKKGDDDMKTGVHKEIEEAEVIVKKGKRAYEDLRVYQHLTIVESPTGNEQLMFEACCKLEKITNILKLLIKILEEPA